MPKQMCQSCGQPLKSDNRGSEADGSASATYCNLCYENGSFKQPDITLEEMKEKYITALAGMHVPKFLGKLFANSQLPKLARWQQ